LDIQYELDKIQNRISKESLKDRIHSLWRYRELLPLAKDESIVSLQEGMTPLKRASRYGLSIGLTELVLKLDYLNPTGSFKDRGNTVNVSRLRELNINSVIEDSSGNAGSSLAAYCASGGIHCTLYVPEYTVHEKLIQAQIYGAEIVKIAGSRTDVAKAAENVWRNSGKYYASHNLSPFFFDGMKTVAYEIAEELHWQTPDHIVFPVGGGALMGGTWKGLRELISLGWVERLPRLHCVQSEACMPIVEAFEKHIESIRPAIEKETIAGGIRISNPARGSQILQALKHTDGMAVSVSDDSILKHQKLLARMEGIFVEPTSCAALAGLETLREIGVISNHESVIVPLTGFGLKDAKSAAIEAHH
jgi:threonine synthase